MAIIEYPKALYKGGEYISVASETEELERREDGFLDWRDDFKRLTAGECDEADDAPAPVAAPIAPPRLIPQERAPRAPLGLKSAKSA